MYGSAVSAAFEIDVVLYHTEGVEHSRGTWRGTTSVHCTNRRRNRQPSTTTKATNRHVHLGVY